MFPFYSHIIRINNRSFVISRVYGNLLLLGAGAVGKAVEAAGSGRGLALSLTGLAGVLLSSEGDLVQDELGDWVGEGGGDGEEVRLGLEAVLVSHILDEDLGTVRSGVARRRGRLFNFSFTVLVGISNAKKIVWTHMSANFIQYPNTYEYCPALTTASSSPSGDPAWAKLMPLAASNSKL